MMRGFAYSSCLVALVATSGCRAPATSATKNQPAERERCCEPYFNDSDAVNSVYGDADHCSYDAEEDGKFPNTDVELTRPTRFTLTFERIEDPEDIEVIWVCVDTSGLDQQPDKCPSDPTQENEYCPDRIRIVDTGYTWSISPPPSPHATRCKYVDAGEERRFTDTEHRRAFADGQVVIEVQSSRGDTYQVNNLVVSIKVRGEGR